MTMTRTELNAAVWELHRRFTDFDCEGYIYGGALRDLDLGIIPKDLDIIVKLGEGTWDQFKEFVSDLIVSTEFSHSIKNGIRLKVHGAAVDIWPLGSTYGAHSNITNVLNHTDFSCNEIIQSVQSFLDNGLFSAIKSVEYLKGKDLRQFWYTNPVFLREGKIAYMENKLGYAFVGTREPALRGLK